jgi:hypothetical protein
VNQNKGHKNVPRCHVRSVHASHSSEKISLLRKARDDKRASQRNWDIDTRGIDGQLKQCEAACFITFSSGQIMSDDLKKLPDYPALHQLGRALWRDGSARGAALMVGAGFSRNAVLPGLDTKAPPLWSSLIDEMGEQLYPNSKDRPGNALRIAEEYRVYFGQAVLDEFIKARCPDKAWQPGQLHIDVLRLPWADVLTTNWDTLLERASESVEQSYDVVSLESHLPHARAPRIIKLHGSLGDAGPLIFAEEDYRTYPEKHAAFLNLARQVFVENELCLLGFSGDDPNFLQWAGWVRDQLGGNARRIYLVGCLELSASKRRYFEANNVSVIDLSSLVDSTSADKHARVTQIFLKALAEARPSPVHEWVLQTGSSYPQKKEGANFYPRTRSDVDFCAKALKETAALWRIDRSRYPGWLVCPHSLRQSLQVDMAEGWLYRVEALQKLTVHERAEVLFELAWRRTMSATPMTKTSVAAIAEFLQQHGTDCKPETRGFLLVTILRQERTSFDEVEFEKWLQMFDHPNIVDETWRLELLYQKALFERDKGDLAKVLEVAEQMNSDDAVWKLRQASLYAEAGRHAQATRQIKSATSLLETAYRRDRASLWLQARLGWADFVHRGTVAANWKLSAELPAARDFTTVQVDPNKEIERISVNAQRIQREQSKNAFGLVPLFEAGHYRAVSDSNTIVLDESQWKPWFELDSVMEQAGIPLRINHVSYCSKALLQSLEICHQPTLRWYVAALRALHSPYDGEFERWFSRVAMAQLEEGVARELLMLARRMVEFWLNRFSETRGAEPNDDRSIARDELRLYLMALARLSVRMTESEAKEVFLQSLAWATNLDLQHHWVLSALMELGKYSSQAISRDGQKDVIWAVMDFPLSSESGVAANFWPSFIEFLEPAEPDRQSQGALWTHRVAQLLSACEPNHSARPEAIRRLTFLAHRGVLTAEESAAFGRALWAGADEAGDDLPTRTGLLCTTLISLPAPEQIDAPARVRRKLFDAPIADTLRVPDSFSSGDIQDRQNFVIALLHAVELKMAPSSLEAARMFDEFLAWGASEESKSEDTLASGMDLPTWAFERSGEVISDLLVPALTDAERTQERGVALLKGVEANNGWGGLAGLCFFVKCLPILERKLPRLIMKGLIASNHRGIQSATSALLFWADREDEVGTAVPDEVYNRLVSAVEVAPEHSLHTLLSCARQLVLKTKLNRDFAHRLLLSLGDLRTQADYSEVDPSSPRAISISLVRAECVLLASALLEKVEDDGSIAAWLLEARSDALPEVRLALANQPH